MPWQPPSQDHRRPRTPVRQHSRHRRRHAGHPDQQPRRRGRDPLRQGRVLQSCRVGEGPAGAQHHRGGRAQRRAEARPDRRRSDQRQHRHRTRHGVRAEGLSAGRHHGRQLLDRAAQADAHARRQGGADAARRRRASACTAKRSSSPRQTDGSSRASSRPTPTPTSTRATTAREIINDFAGQRLDYFVTGYGTGGTLAGVAAYCAGSGPRPGSSSASRPTPSSSAADTAGARRGRRARGQPPGFEPHPIQGWTRTSSRWSCRRRSTGIYDEVIPVAGADGVNWARALAAKEGILTGISGGSTFAVALRVAGRPGRIGHPAHASRYRRTLSLLAPVRRYRRGA